MRHTDTTQCGQEAVKAPAISVLLPVFNSARTLAGAIASILGQTCTRWELLILDDGSTDRSLEVASTFSDPRIHILKGPHLGLAAQLNRGVAYSQATYCARMDADDLAFPQRLQRQFEFLESRPEVDLVSASIGVFHSDGSLIGVRRTRQTHAELSQKAWASIPMAHPTWMGRAHWFKSHPYHEQMRGMEDRELLTRTSSSSVFAGIPEVLLAYREDTISLRKQLLARRETLRHLSFRGSPATAVLLGAAQAYRFLEEIGACATGSQHRLQKRRVMPPTGEERSGFERLWSRLSEQVAPTPGVQNQ